MVTSTEQNTDASVEDVKVIAIKLPFDLQERLLAFPLLHAISEKWPKADLHFITPRKEIEVLNLLPFTAYYHVFDEDEIKTVFDVHRYCANAKIFNVDIFISLTNSFPDACLGLGLRAKKRVGFSDGWKGLVLTHKTPRPRGHHLTEDFYALYAELIGANPDTRLKVSSRPLNKIIKSQEKDGEEGEENEAYIAINLSPLRVTQIEEEFIELINQFEEQKIILFSSEEQARAKMVMEPFMAHLSSKNKYINFVYQDWIEMGKMLAHATGVITFNGPCATFSAYVGAKTLVLFDSEDPQKYGPFYFQGEVIALGVNDPTLTNPVAGSVIKDRKTFNMSEVATKAMGFFRL